MITALTHLQHVRDKHVIYVAIWKKRPTTSIGASTSCNLKAARPRWSCRACSTEVVTLAVLKADDGSSYRGFVTRADNPFGYPSKDRSGRLDAIEEPHLGKLIAKCLGQDTSAQQKLTHLKEIT